jgi:hypothetical protein
MLCGIVAGYVAGKQLLCILIWALIGAIVAGDGLSSAGFSLGNFSNHDGFRGILPFLDLAISEMQETSYWPTYCWNVMSEQRKPNRQHPNTYYGKREETPGNDERDPSQHPQPYHTPPTEAVESMTD